ncbi:GNAT family N-acetyltransferase [Nocardioides acrostichi]|uniref:GNAT family N-acetyltransferase n=1 Tax=Nocardioides acrostichi TaxID=2784339 RepID=A0A930UYL0_9ACTN|nr:GNAT family N-acetyltransferase [Nocardioides acrostichi]MBF4160636.1 GNAT family N-acetyltransferase [Nocardioides acrostichi]
MTPSEIRAAKNLDPEAGLLLAPATAEDLPAVAELFLRARAAASQMPPLVHSEEDVRAHVCGWDLDVSGRELWLARDADGALRGFVRVEGDWLDDLYVDPARQRHGVGSALLTLVMGLRPRGFGLWVFESNAVARAFYAWHGLLERETTDGSDNEEGAPDVRMEWCPGGLPTH